MENSLLIVIIVLLLFLIIRNERKTNGCPCQYMERFPAVDNRYRSGKGGHLRNQEYEQWQTPLPRNDYRYYSTYGFDFDTTEEEY